ncbi:hypothetical protein P7C73_g5431, partial [Tremellales sp. Uapishka_1]
MDHLHQDWYSPLYRDTNDLGLGQDFETWQQAQDPSPSIDPESESSSVSTPWVATHHAPEVGIAQSTGSGEELMIDPSSQSPVSPTVARRHYQSASNSSSAAAALIAPVQHSAARKGISCLGDEPISRDQHQQSVDLLVEEGSLISQRLPAGTSAADTSSATPLKRGMWVRFSNLWQTMLMHQHSPQGVLFLSTTQTGKSAAEIQLPLLTNALIAVFWRQTCLWELHQVQQAEGPQIPQPPSFFNTQPLVQGVQPRTASLDPSALIFSDPLHGGYDPTNSYDSSGFISFDNLAYQPLQPQLPASFAQQYNFPTATPARSSYDPLAFSQYSTPHSTLPQASQPSPFAEYNLGALAPTSSPFPPVKPPIDRSGSSFAGPSRTPYPAIPPTPSDSTPPIWSSLVDPKSPHSLHQPVVAASAMYPEASSLHYIAGTSDPVDGLSERLGEFLFSPTESIVTNDQARKKKKTPRQPTGARYENSGNALMASRWESDGLLDSARTLLLDATSASSDRLMDAIRAAMLLAAYSYSSGRHHEGWIMAGRAVRLVLSTGLHQISSCVFKPDPPRDPFLRNKVFLLPPPQDALELGERIHTFWCTFAIDRCGAVGTGFPSGMKDEDIKTPFARPLVEIASRSVSERDDYTVKDLYKTSFQIHPEGDSPYTKWVKCVALLERACKLAFLEPESASPYSTAWTAFAANPVSTPPPAWLDTPEFRNPTAFEESKLGLQQLVLSMGEEGVSPVERKKRADVDNVELFIPTHTIMLHHLLAAIEMMMYDVNSKEAENIKGLAGARKSVVIFREMAPLPFTDADAFVVLVWSFIAKVLIKEMARLNRLGDAQEFKNAQEEADTVISEISRIGATMHLARTQAKAMRELQKLAFQSTPTSSTGNMDEFFNLPPGF